MKRIIYASNETALQATNSANGIVKVYSFWPIDKANCPCQTGILRKVKEQMKKMNNEERQAFLKQQNVIECDRSREGMNRYEIYCTKCGEVQGVCWATDDSLIDWCDFHYTQWTKGDYWRGCFTPHISPVTQTLAFECCCGQDTRDFRANMTLKKEVAEKIESKNSIGRAFNTANSKFRARKIKNNMVL